MPAFLSPQWMLLTGILLSPFAMKLEALPKWAKVWSTKLLQASVIILGASMNSSEVLRLGLPGVALTLTSVLVVILAGASLGKFLKIESAQKYLLTMGTAICGGSAIAATVPLIGAESMAITISISIVFLLNSLSIFLFPWIGGMIELSQTQFGIWAALAIHDTSSVVAAATIYGPEALAVATTIKLIRTLWLIPLTVLISSQRMNSSGARAKLPPFIFLFLFAVIIFNFFEPLKILQMEMGKIAKLGFSLTLFFIGLSFDLKKFARIGMTSFIFAVLLWIFALTVGLILAYIPI
jgi:uncharacterized integral membrane protein (TIGR00698 family)